MPGPTPPPRIGKFAGAAVPLMPSKPKPVVKRRPVRPFKPPVMTKPGFINR